MSTPSSGTLTPVLPRAPHLDCQATLSTTNSQPIASPTGLASSTRLSGWYKDGKCRCRCSPECDCSCPCQDHCVCSRKFVPDDHKCDTFCNLGCNLPCNLECGSQKNFRNLVVCLDGTANEFGHRNTNVVELHNRILKDDPDVPQITYYSSGIGTYVPPRKYSPSYWWQLLDSGIDQTFAWNFKGLVEAAYRWLADHYQQGDRIYLFGFSRGAYQIRALAGMIAKLGLVYSGNLRIIPFGCELYANRYKGKKIRDAGEAEGLAEIFRTTFSRTVKVHFVGAWDTVSSVGFLGSRPLSLTQTADHICFFRHGLALDERRVKFLPEYLDRGQTPQFGRLISSGFRTATDVEEVWFVGSHSDIGGKNRRTTLQQGFGLSQVPLTWMINEATAAGLRFLPRPVRGEWKWDSLQQAAPTKSLNKKWRIVECLCIPHLSYVDASSTTRMPNLGRGRTIVPKQRVHASVAFMKREYKPHALFTQDTKEKWEQIVGVGKVDPLYWADEWQDILDVDLYEDFHADDIITKLKILRASDSIDRDKKEKARSETSRLLQRLSFMALSDHGARKISKIIEDLVRMMSDSKHEAIRAESASCLFQLAKHWYHPLIMKYGAGEKLKAMLDCQAGQTCQISSLRCLSQLLLRPNDIGDKRLVERGGMNISYYYSEDGKGREDGKSKEDRTSVQKVLLDKLESWFPVLNRTLLETSGTEPTLGAGCLARVLHNDEVRIKWVARIKSQPHTSDDEKASIPLANINRIIELLTKNATECHAASILRLVSKDVFEDISPDNIDDMVLALKKMILNGHGKSKGSAVRCLDVYYVKDSVTKHKSLTGKDFAATLFAELFGKNDHCRSRDLKFVREAFLSMAKKEAPLKAHIRAPSVIRKIIKVICVEAWLSEEEGSSILCTILSGDDYLKRDSKETYIKELVFVGRDTSSLSRTQVIFSALCGNESTVDLVLKPEVLGTILTALKLPGRSRINAVGFLKCIFPSPRDHENKKSKGGLHNKRNQNFRPMDRKQDLKFNDLISRIVELARKSPKDKELLSYVRKALKVFCNHETFKPELLQKAVLETITRDINLKTANMHYGHGVEAQVSGIKCLRRLVKYDLVELKLIDYKLVEQILEIRSAFRDEPDSCQWLRLWPEYGKRLENVLAELKKSTKNIKELTKSKDEGEIWKRLDEIDVSEAVTVDLDASKEQVAT